ncbi:hypothetical protein MSAN_01961700 [Mycena sanguinolenta]|uniref:Uncharacterized protein n=1 Tax=Mycena sanguinolenta TaxID=230812 RepID=A0A8H6XNU8_9AGAR|nr:hypothetical protein MSAN_01961700 [Mycena sanguinolenta]
MGRTDDQLARVRKMIALNAKSSANRLEPPGSPITPRRQRVLHLLDLEKQKTADLTAKCAEITQKRDTANKRIDFLSARLHNLSRVAARAKAARLNVRADLRRSKHNTAVLRSRFDRRKADAIEKALNGARIAVKKHWMKGRGGIFTEASREMVCDLVGLKVTSANVNGVVGHIVEEGGIASDIQVASEIRAAQAFTASGDGTTIRHLNYEAKHVTYYKTGEMIPVTRMLDTTSAPNHTSEEQFASWQSIIKTSLVDTYNASPLGQDNPLDDDEFVTFLKGLGSDHSPDQAHREVSTFGPTEMQLETKNFRLCKS